MNKYTVFYRYSFRVGSHTHNLFHYQLVEAPSDLSGLPLLDYICTEYDIDDNSIEYLVHGWVEMVGAAEDKPDKAKSEYIAQIMPSRERLEAIAKRNPIPQEALDEEDIP